MSRARCGRGRGFTLVELLVALAVFAVISVLSLRAVSGAIESRARIEDEGRKWRELGRLFSGLENDLANLLVTGSLALEGAAAPAADDGAWLRFVRSGRGEAGETAIAPRAIAYRLAGGHVERASYAALNAYDAPLAATRYPSAIRTLTLRYLSERNEWQSQWSRADGDLPRALELVVELASGERLRRVLLVR